MRYILFLVLICQLVACTSNTLVDPKTSNKALTYASVNTYHVGVDDVLMVNVWKNPDLSVTVPVRPDGRISIPLVGDVVAGGKEPMIIAAEIKVALEKFIREPQVTVMLTQLRSHEFISRVRVTGAVNSPSSLPYRQGMTVLDAFLQAGGANEFASTNAASLYRSENDAITQYDIYLSDIVHSGRLDTNYVLLPGDIITVPERLF